MITPLSLESNFGQGKVDKVSVVLTSGCSQKRRLASRWGVGALYNDFFKHIPLKMFSTLLPKSTKGTSYTGGDILLSGISDLIIEMEPQFKP